MTSAEIVYVLAGIVLPLFYLPQIRRCMQDQTMLASYSLRKSAFQCALRVAMMPFIMHVANQTMVMVVSLDLMGRGLELLAALMSLRAQGSSWQAMALRVLLGSSPIEQPAEQTASADQARS